MPDYARRCLPGLDAYAVKEGEDIYQIVQQFRIPLKAIEAANPQVDVENISAGDILCLPQQDNFADCSDGEFYFIQEGDSYYRLAQYFSLSVEQLLQANPNTDPSNLQIGQAICLPTNAASPYCSNGTVPYQLKQGDSFYHLANVFHIPVESLLQTNPQADPYQLQIGQIICLPIQWKVYFNQYYHVSFMHPDDWSKVNYSPIRYKGESGFFEITGLNASSPSDPETVASLREVCNQFVNNDARPYGANPTIEKTRTDGQPACLIMPSNDQGEEYENRATLIVKYPKPYVTGQKLSHYLVIHGDKNHIRGIANTLKLLNVEKDRKLTKKQAENLVKRALGLMGQQAVHVRYNNTINGQYLIQVFDIVNNHIATRGWYLVNPETGEISQYM